MEITFNVVIKAPEIVDAINNLAGATLTAAGLSGNATRPDKAVKSAATKSTTTAPAPAPAIATEPVAAQTNPDPLLADETGQWSGKVSLETVRAKLHELSQKGADLKPLLAKFGAEKLSKVPADRYSELMDEAAKL